MGKKIISLLILASAVTLSSCAIGSFSSSSQVSEDKSSSSSAEIDSSSSTSGYHPSSSSSASESSSTSSSSSKSSSSSSSTSSSSSSSGSSSSNYYSSSSQSQPSNPDDPNENPTDGNPAITLPPATKCAYLVKLTFTTALPSYASVFLTGCMQQIKDVSGKLTSVWSYGLNAIEMQPIEGNQGWYVGYTNEIWNTASYASSLGSGVTGQPNHYSLVVGYNNSAEINDSKKGLQWVDNFKSDYTLTFTGLDTPSFTCNEGDNVRIILHSDNFSNVPTKPASALKNYQIKVAFKKTVNNVTSLVAIPTWEIPHLFGNFNSWKTDYNSSNELEARMTPNADRTIWSYTFDEIIPDTYEATMSIDWTIESMGTSASSVSSYKWDKPDNWRTANMKIIINSMDGDSFVPNDNDAIEADVTKCGLLADPSKNGTITFNINNTGTPLAASVAILIHSDIYSYGISKNCEYPNAVSSESSITKYSITIANATAQTYSFYISDGVQTSAHGLYASATSASKFSFSLADGQNLVITVEGDMSYFGTADTEHSFMTGTCSIA